jgi:site-specific recombinase XerD
MERAEIDKKITWHCARHSFGTNLLVHGADVFVTSKLLGHTSLKHTQRYVRAAEEMKRDALNKLPEIKL